MKRAGRPPIKEEKEFFFILGYKVGRSDTETRIAYLTDFERLDLLNVAYPDSKPTPPHDAAQGPKE